MKKNIRIENYIFSIVFLMALFVLSTLSAINAFPKLINIVDEVFEDINTLEAEEKNVENVTKIVSDGILQIDSSITENVHNRYAWIEEYGRVNRLLGKNEINGLSYAIDKNGAYNAVNFWSGVKDHNIQRYSQQIFMLKEYAEEKGSKFFFLAFPSKYDDAWNNGYNGIPYNDFNSQMDELLLWNRRYGIDYIDFREVLKESGLSFYDMFYRTDHHWTAYAAFLCFEELVNYMNEKFLANLDESGFYRDIDNYDMYWIEDKYLGSYGRNIGIEFLGMGLEDFQVIKPKFSFKIKYDGIMGDYEDTVLKKKVLNYSNMYRSDMYNYYLSAINDKDLIINKDNPDGLKIFFIRDSFSAPLIIDMIPFCSKIDCVWGKISTDDYVKKMIEEQDYDYVILGYYPDNLSYPEFFQFFSDDYPKEEE